VAIKPFYTSNSLIETVKRSMSMPISQITFSDEDILAFATEELYLSQLPSILQYHEEYYVYEQIVPLKPNVSRYPIPNRAIGMKLRDLFYLDTQNQLVEMSKINPDDEPFFTTDGNTSTVPIYYKIENNSIVIVPEIRQNFTGSFVFKYYLRPNALVKDEKAAICRGFSKLLTVQSLPQPGDAISIAGTSFVADTDYAIGANTAITASNLGSAIVSSGLDVQVTVTGSEVSVLFFDRRTEFSVVSGIGISVQTTITVQTSAVPEEIQAGGLVDILQEDGGHSTYKIDVRLAPGSVSPTSITLKESDLDEDFVIGDYICAQYSCIVPQIPTDLHILLAERTAARIMQAMGDRDGMNDSQRKIQDYEARQATLLDSRVEGSPAKILNRHSLLRYGKITRRGK
jgi:hypothetical protein